MLNHKIDMVGKETDKKESPEKKMTKFQLEFEKF